MTAPTVQSRGPGRWSPARRRGGNPKAFGVRGPTRPAAPSGRARWPRLPHGARAASGLPEGQAVVHGKQTRARRQKLTGSRAAPIKKGRRERVRAGARRGGRATASRPGRGREPLAGDGARTLKGSLEGSPAAPLQPSEPHPAPVPGVWVRRRKLEVETAQLVPLQFPVGLGGRLEHTKIQTRPAQKAARTRPSANRRRTGAENRKRSNR